MRVDTSYVPRRYEREAVRKIAHIQMQSGEDRIGAGAYTLDMSARGTRLHTSLDLTPGQIIEFQPDDSTFVTRCRVVWTGNPATPTEGQAGVEFLETFPAPVEV